MSKLKSKLANLEANLQKTAADLGEKNIPRELIDAMAPEAVQVLFWREEASTPPDTTIELWKTTENNYIVVEGLYNEGWFGEKIKCLEDSKGPLFESLEAGMAAIRRTYTLLNDEDPHEQIVSNRKGRLIRKAK